ncbi:MAG: hypothetical protein ACXWC7_17735, partial [Chitinophagaceae bacterium]
SEPGKDFNDFIFLAANQDINVNSRTLLTDQVEWLKNRLFPIDNKEGMILTDNLNPLEHLQTAKAEHYRHFIVDWLGPELLVR